MQNVSTFFLHSCNPENRYQLSFGQCEFTREQSLGFQDFASIEDILNPENGYIHNDSIKVKVLLEVELRKPRGKAENKNTSVINHLGVSGHVCKDNTW